MSKEKQKRQKDEDEEEKNFFKIVDGKLFILVKDENGNDVFGEVRYE